MNRRGFLSSLLTAGAVAAVDPERLWVPGQKTIFIPKDVQRWLGQAGRITASEIRQREEEAFRKLGLALEERRKLLLGCVIGSLTAAPRQWFHLSLEGYNGPDDEPGTHDADLRLWL